MSTQAKVRLDKDADGVVISVSAEGWIQKVNRALNTIFPPAAVERAKEAARQLQEKGIIDAEGRRVRKDLPSDMREGQDRDFGG